MSLSKEPLTGNILTMISPYDYQPYHTDSSDPIRLILVLCSTGKDGHHVLHETSGEDDSQDTSL